MPLHRLAVTIGKACLIGRGEESPVYCGTDFPPAQRTLRGRRADICSSTLQQLQVLSISLRSALHLSVVLLVRYRLPSG